VGLVPRPIVGRAPRSRQRTGEANRRALVFGDSQTEAMGGALADLLRQRGYEVEVSVNKGYTTKRLYEKLVEIYDPGIPPDLVFFFAGGNDARKGKDFGESVRDLVGYANAWGGTPVFWTGPAPQTRIADKAEATAVFGLSPDVRDDYWLGDRSAQREEYNRKLRAQVEATGATFIDLRDAGLGGPMQGEFPFPDLADGVHVTGETAQRAAEHIAALALPGEAEGKGTGRAAMYLAAAVAGTVIVFAVTRRG